MTKMLTESFSAFRGGGVPTLRMRQHVKTISLEWNDCGLIRDAIAFKAALDSEAMTAELNTIWRRYRPQCKRGASYSHGFVGGHMSRVPPEAGIEAMDAIRRHYTGALEEIRGVRQPVEGTTIEAKDAVVWINNDTREVMVRRNVYDRDVPREWCDPIGAAYSDWKKGTDEFRVQTMLETAIDLAMQGFALKDLLKEFAKVRQFRALGSQSFPMCRALTSALVGRCLEPNTMSFEELLVHYAPKENAR